MTLSVTKIMARVKCVTVMLRNRAKYLTLHIKVLYSTHVTKKSPSNTSMNLTLPLRLFSVSKNMLCPVHVVAGDNPLATVMIKPDHDKKSDDNEIIFAI